jgi:hypothetical protein
VDIVHGRLIFPSGEGALLFFMRLMSIGISDFSFMMSNDHEEDRIRGEREEEGEEDVLCALCRLVIEKTDMLFDLDPYDSSICSGP